jgi:hypothetical protein
MPLPPSHFVAVNESENGRWYLQHILQTPVIMVDCDAKEGAGLGRPRPGAVILSCQWLGQWMSIVLGADHPTPKHPQHGRI